MEESLHHSYYFGEEPGGRADPEGRWSKLIHGPLKFHPQAPSGRWIVWDLQVGVLQIQAEDPVVLFER